MVIAEAAVGANLYGVLTFPPGGGRSQDNG